MAVTLAQLAVALRIQTSPTADPAEPYLGILTRLQGVATALVDVFASTAPDAIKDEATVRVAGYLFDQPNAGVRSSYGAAWANSGAAALVAPWAGRRALAIEAATAAVAGGGVDEAAVNRLIAAYVAAWAAAGSSDPVPLDRLAAEVQHAADQVPRLTVLLEDMALEEMRTWRQTTDEDGKFTWSRSRPANAAAAAALTDYANSRQNQPAVDAVDPALAFYWLTARIPTDRSIEHYRYRQHQGGHHGFIYDATGHDLGEEGEFHYWSVQFLLLSGNSTSFEYDELEGTSTRYGGELGAGIVDVQSLGSDVLAAIQAGGGGGGTILPGSIGTAQLADAAVTTAKLASGAVSTTRLAGVVRERLAPALAGGTAGQYIRLNAAGTALEFVDAPSGGGGSIGAGSITIANLAAAVLARMAPTLTGGSAGQYLALNSGRSALEFVNAPSGTVGTGSIDTEQLADNAVDGDKIASDAVTSRHYAPVSIRQEYISGATLTERVLADNAIITRTIKDGAVTAAKLASGAVTIQPGSVGTSDLEDLAVTSEKLAANAVSGPKIASAAVGTTELVNGAVTASKLGDHAVENVKLHASVNARMAPLSAAGTGAIGGSPGQYLALNAAASAIVFVDAPSGGGGGAASRTTIYDTSTNWNLATIVDGVADESLEYPVLGIASALNALVAGELEIRLNMGDDFGTYFRFPVSDWAVLPSTSQSTGRSMYDDGSFRPLNTVQCLAYTGFYVGDVGTAAATPTRLIALFGKRHGGDMMFSFVTALQAYNSNFTQARGRFLDHIINVRVVHIG